MKLFPHTSMMMEAKQTIPIKLGVPVKRRDDLH